MYSHLKTANFARCAQGLIRKQTTDGSKTLLGSTSPTVDPPKKDSQPVSMHVAGATTLSDVNTKIGDTTKEMPTSFLPQFATRKATGTNLESQVFSIVEKQSEAVKANLKKFSPKISLYVPPKNIGVMANSPMDKKIEPTQSTESLDTSVLSSESTKPFYLTQGVKDSEPHTLRQFMEEVNATFTPHSSTQAAIQVQQNTQAALLDTEKQWQQMVKMAAPFEEMPGPWSFKLVYNILKYIPIIGTQLTARSMLYGMEMIGAHLAWQQKVLPFFHLYEQYGPIVRLQGIFGGDILFLSRPEHIAQVYRQEGPYPVRSSLDSLEQYRLKHRKLRSAGPFIMSGPEWADLRSRLEVPLRNSVTQYQGTIEQVCDDFITRIRDIRNKQEEVPTDFQHEILKWGVECMGLVAYNKRLGCLMLTGQGMNVASEAARLLDATVNASKALRGCESYIQWWRFFESPSWKRLVTSCDEIDSVTSKHIRLAQNRLRSTKGSDLCATQRKIADMYEHGQPLLDTLLLTEHVLPEDILTIVLDMMLIGANSTCHAVGFLFYHLAKCPRIQRQLYEEIKSEVPHKNQRLTYNDLKKLPLLQASVMESLRLNPPIPSMTRVLPKDMAIHNYRIPKGTYVVMTSHVACLKEENFEDALKFKPERWLNDEKDIHPFAAIPFGSGVRACIGRGLAELQMWMLAAKVIRNFRIEYNYGEIKAKRHFIGLPTKPLKFRFVDRTNE